MARNLADSIEQVVLEPASLSSNLKSTLPFSLLQPAVPEEIILIIRILIYEKTIHEQDIDTNCLEYSNQIISPFICDLFYSCIEQVKFLTALKIAEVILTFKKSDPNQTTNYKPIPLLSQFSKILAKLMFNRLYSFLEKYYLFTRHQYRYRKNSWTVCKICSIYDRLIKNTDAGLCICCSFLDQTKAFDTIDLAKLLNKMYHSFGIKDIANLLLESYLSDRKQYTKVFNNKSKMDKITHGIPQSLILGLLLFLLYVNELPLVSEFETTLFADDTYMAIFDKSITDLECKVNKELIKIDR